MFCCSTRINRKKHLIKEEPTQQAKDNHVKQISVNYNNNKLDATSSTATNTRLSNNNSRQSTLVMSSISLLSVKSAELSQDDIFATQMAMLTNSLTDKSKKIEHIIECLDKLNNMPSQYCCFLSEPWNKLFIKYLLMDGKIPPIDNFGLLEKIVLKTLSKNDFEIVSKPAYTYLQSLFEGGPIIETEKKNANLSYLINEYRCKIVEKYRIDVFNFSRLQLAKKIENEEQQVVDVTNFLKTKDIQGDGILSSNEKNMKLSPTNEFNLPNIGLHNQSIYCYLNSVLQSLLSINVLVSEILNQNLTSKNTGFCKGMQSFITELPSNKKVGSNSIIKNLLPQNLKHSQQDAHECLTIILSRMQEELSTKNFKKSKSMVIDSEDAAEEYRKLYYNTYIDNIFMGRYTASFQCKSCEKITKNYDPFYDLSLAINNTDVKQMLRNYFKKETIEFTCEFCKKHTTATKSLEIARLPPILIIQIKRFVYIPEKKKIHKSVNFDSEINLEQFATKKCKSEVSSTYDLIAGIEHSGECDSGHYFAFCKRNGNWWLFNDEKACAMNTTKLINLEPYILIYERREQNSGQNFIEYLRLK